jgi:hypothetical protein
MNTRNNLKESACTEDLNNRFAKLGVDNTITIMKMLLAKKAQAITDWSIDSKQFKKYVYENRFLYEILEHIQKDENLILFDILRSDTSLCFSEQIADYLAQERSTIERLLRLHSPETNDLKKEYTEFHRRIEEDGLIDPTGEFFLYISKPIRIAKDPEIIERIIDIAHEEGAEVIEELVAFRGEIDKIFTSWYAPHNVDEGYDIITIKEWLKTI